MGAHGMGRRRPWDGCGARVVSSERKRRPSGGGQDSGYFTALTLDCGHRMSAPSGPNSKPGTLVICEECMRLGGRPGEPRRFR